MQTADLVTEKKKSIEAVFTLNRLVSGWAWWVEVQQFIQAELKLWVMAGLDLPASEWKSHRTESSHLWAWTKSPATQRPGGMTSRPSSLLPPPQGGDWGSGPVWVDSPTKGRGGLNGLGESRQAQKVCSRNKQTHQKEAMPWVCHSVCQRSTLQLPIPPTQGAQQRGSH